MTPEEYQQVLAQRQDEEEKICGHLQMTTAYFWEFSI